MDFHVYLYGRERGALGISFEAASDALSEIDSLYFEPDGSLVWSDPPHQVFGMLYDAAGSLQYVELRGRCDLIHWRRLTNVFLADRASASVLVLPQQELQDLQCFEQRSFDLSDGE